MRMSCIHIRFHLLDLVGSAYAMYTYQASQLRLRNKPVGTLSSGRMCRLYQFAGIHYATPSTHRRRYSFEIWVCDSSSPF